MIAIIGGQKLQQKLHTLHSVNAKNVIDLFSIGQAELEIELA